MDGMGAFAFVVLIAAGAYTIRFCINRSYKLGYDKGFAEADELAKETTAQLQKARLAVSVVTAELERFRDELLSRDAHTFVNSI
jgi:hypothetical protein